MTDSVFYLQLAMLAIGAFLFGECAHRFRLPRVVGEMFVGVVLGPTVLKRLLPDVYQIIAPHGVSHPQLTAIASLAVTMLLFAAGIEFDLKLMRSAFRKSWKISIGGFVTPFLFGFVPALLLPDLIGLPPGSNGLLFATFVGAVLSVTALSVLVDMLMDWNIYKTPFSMMVVTAALTDNILSWTLVGAVFQSGSIGASSGRTEPAVTLFGSLLFVVLMFTVGRIFLSLFLKAVDRLCSDPRAVTGIVLGLCLLSASFSCYVGLDGVFGAFIAGSVIGSCDLKEKTRQSIKQFVWSFLAPVYFAFLGLRVDFIANFSFTLVPIIFILACAGKILGCFLAARLEKIPPVVSWSTGLIMNSRGAMAIILAHKGLESHIIDERMFVAMAVMAVFTSVIAGLMLGPKVGILAREECLTAEGVQPCLT